MFSLIYQLDYKYILQLCNSGPHYNNKGLISDNPGIIILALKTFALKL